MKLIYVLASILAISLAESEQRVYEDLEAAESGLRADAYNSVPYPAHNWNQNQPQYPQTTWTAPQPQPIQNDYAPPQTWNPPQTWVPPQHQTTTPVPVIKNEHTQNADGSYNYEYQIADGTHVSETGYFTDASHKDESLVKKGWYSYRGADGKAYTVTWWADHSGYHAFGDHLPTPAPIPPAIQASIDQNAKEEAEKNQHQRPVYHDPPQVPSYPSQNPIYYPPQQPQNPIHYPQQPQYYPQTNYPSGK